MYTLCLIALSTLTPTADTDVEGAARGYRVAIYQTFRTDRSQYDRRRDVADELVNRWVRSGRSDRLGREIVQWFQDARNAVVEGNQEPGVPTDRLSAAEQALELEEANDTSQSSDSRHTDRSEFDEFAATPVTTDTDVEHSEQENQVEASSDQGGVIQGIGRALGDLLGD